jgi:hypothetical protein
LVGEVVVGERRRRRKVLWDFEEVVVRVGVRVGEEVGEVPGEGEEGVGRVRAFLSFSRKGIVVVGGVCGGES